MIKRLPFLLAALLACSSEPTIEDEPNFTLEVEQVTQGPNEHFFGYIGHVQNIPWNGADRYVLALRVGFHDRMPTPDDAAEIVLLDSQNGYQARKLEETRAWNPQQGTMMYWNPSAPDTQFFFNDRDPETDKIFTVLYDVEQGRRVREYLYEDSPVGNGGVRQNGRQFAAINYGRMARLRPVTGYPDAYDWNPRTSAPDDDGVFSINIGTGERDLLVSFEEMRDALAERHPHIADTPLFINHTLWNRDGDRLWFFVRGNFGNREKRVNVPMTIGSDGENLAEQKVFIGGHPEWELGARMIGVADEGADGARLVLYDSETQQIVEELGSREIFPDPGNDIALSPDANWIVQGFEVDAANGYSVYRRSDGAWAHTKLFDQADYDSGNLRIDAAPKWNRAGNQILFSSLTDDPEPTRQLFVIRIVADE